MGDPSRPLTVFTARRVVTMEPARPEATAVAVLDGRIAGVGSLDDLAPWTDAHPHTVDRTFEDKVVLPGFVDPHLHPLLPAVLTQMPFVAPDDWHLPTGTYPGVVGHDAFVARLRELLAGHDPATGPFFTWGYHPLFHGETLRPELDAAVSADVPVVLWHRSFHELIANTPALEWMGITRIDDVPQDVRSQVDLAGGRFYERGLAAAFPALAGLFFRPERLAGGFTTFVEMVHRGGVTTVADMGTGLYTPVTAEAELIRQALERDDVPFRTVLTPITTAYWRAGTSPEAALAECDALHQRNGRRVFFDRHVKLMADGAFFSQLMRLCEPGYIDGHEGEWIVPTDVTDGFAETFWRAGYQLHIHCNGDEGARYAVGLLQRLLDGHPRFDHRFSLEHLGYATEEQNRRIAALGAVVSGQVYYVHVLADAYARHGLGADRAQQMCRFGSLVDKGVPLALHSDCTMAPIEPLTLAWVAATRRTMGGTEITPTERLTVEQALRAVTIDAAWVLRLEDQVGSIRAGKKADFVVLEQDPFDVGAEGLRDIPVWGTVFEGAPYPLAEERPRTPAG